MENDKYFIDSVRQDIVNENLSIKALIQVFFPPEDGVKFQIPKHCETVISSVVANVHNNFINNINSPSPTINFKQRIYDRDSKHSVLVQDIHQCCGPMELLNELNAEGRAKLANLRNHIEKLEILAKECVNVEERKDLLEEVKNNRDQLTSTFGAFRKANVACMLAIEKANKEQLFSENDEDSVLKHRLKKDKAGLVKKSSNITEQLLSISRQLADTTQQSSSTLDTLVNSSGNVTSTQQELHNTGSVIAQSGKLLAKYGRREFTDKVIILFAFAFFLACVLFIVQKRLF